MKKYRHISVYDDEVFVLILFIVLTLYINNLILVLFACVYIYKRYTYKEIIIYFLLLSMIFMRLNLKYLNLNYFYINSINNNYQITNIINNIKIKNDLDLEIGDIAYIKGNKIYINDKNDLSNNQYYKYSNFEIKKIFHIPNFRNYIYKLNKTNEHEISRDIINNIMYKSYDNALLNINLSYYFIYRIIDKLLSKIKNHNVISFLIIIIFFGLSYGILRIIFIEYFLSIFKSKKLSISLSAYILILLNPYSIHSYKFIIPFLIRLIYLFKKNDSFLNNMMIIESYFFGEVKILQILFYRFYMMIIYGMLIISLLSLKISFLYPLIDLIYEFYLLFIKIINISIYGKINIIVIGIYLIYKKFFKSYTYTIFLILLLVFNFSNAYSSITFIDVGQGDAILIKTIFNTRNILIDTGNEYAYYKLNRTLKENGVYKIDYLIITHEDADHSANINNLIKDYKVKNIITTHKDIDDKYIYLKSLNKNTYDNDNDNSLVYLLKFNGIAFLFTGDISSVAEQNIIRNHIIDIDILKVSHHGSKTSSSNELLKSITPKIAIISTNGMFNHPSKEVIDRLDKYSINWFSTKEKGNIKFYFTNIYDFIKCSDGEFVIIR